MVALLMLLVWGKASLAARRLHDLGKSGWFSILIVGATIVPIVNLIVFIASVMPRAFIMDLTAGQASGPGFSATVSGERG